MGKSSNSFTAGKYASVGSFIPRLVGIHRFSFSKLMMMSWLGLAWVARLLDTTLSTFSANLGDVSSSGLVKTWRTQSIT